MLNTLAVAVGGAIGAVSRYWITDWMHRRWSTPFPIGTLTVNVVGCLLIGIAVQAAEASRLSPQARLMLVTGLLGALTTFSTFGHETLHSLGQHGWRLALANIAANLVVGFAAVVAGIGIGRFLWHDSLN